MRDGRNEVTGESSETRDLQLGTVVARRSGKPIMVKTWILATTALAIVAVGLVRRWRRYESDAAIPLAGQSVSAEWLSNARAHTDETW